MHDVHSNFLSMFDKGNKCFLLTMDTSKHIVFLQSCKIKKIWLCKVP